jgi:hypothetical protein
MWTAESSSAALFGHREVGMGSAEGIPWICPDMHYLAFHAQHNEFFLQYCRKRKRKNFFFFSNKLIYNLNEHLDRLFTIETI